MFPQPASAARARGVCFRVWKCFHPWRRQP